MSLSSSIHKFCHVSVKRNMKLIREFSTALNTQTGSKKKKVSDHSRGWPEGSLFDSYYTKV